MLMSGHVVTPDPRALRLLVRGVNWLGDSVMTTPALLRLREHFPSSHIALLVPQKLAELWQSHPAIDDVVCITPGDTVWSVGWRLRAGRYDIAVILPNSPRSALEPWLAGIPRRLGYARPWRNWLLTEAIRSRPGVVKMPKRTAAQVRLLQGTAAGAKPASRPVPTTAHQIHDYLHLAASLGADPTPLAPQLFVTKSEIDSVIEKFQLAGALADDRPVLALNPGAEYGPAKRWPAERFGAAAAAIQKRTGCLWLIVGGPKDSGFAAQIMDAAGHPSRMRDLAGRTSLRELCVLLKVSRVLLTNDTGPMHVAAAMGTPVVVPFGATSPDLTGPGWPGDTRHRLLTAEVPCSPCFLRQCPTDSRCMKGITVERVVDAVLGVIGR